MAVNTAKKPKKAVKPVKTALPKRERMTLEEFIAATEKSHEKTEAALQRLDAHADRVWAALDKMSEEVRELSRNIGEEVRELSRNIGGVNNRIGDLVELVVVPKIRLVVNKMGGHSFVDATPDKLVHSFVDGQKKFVAQMDLFLSGPAEAMAVEIKAHLKISYVEEQLRRLRTLRKYEEEAGVKDKKLFGAMVGVIVDKDARKLAKKNGMYVIEIREEEDKLVIDAPETRRTW